MQDDAPLRRPLPALDDTNRFFWTSGADGRLRMLRCSACQTYVHPPRPTCPTCHHADLEPHEVSGRATVVGWTINHHQWHPAFEPPYNIAVVALDDDPSLRLTTNLILTDPDDIELGLAVEVQFLECDDVWLPLFRPIPHGEAG
jgi:uncharacterized OB-fold protein